MRRLGKVLHVSKRGSLIIRTEKTPPSGGRAVVVDRTAEKVGSIVDVFGPVKAPFVAVRPLKGISPEKYVGQILYLFVRKT
ncbi:H/ACA RNA-protein complex protein Gar1 [Candidatus Thorarchaeota archaeon]|nr:MAG: H/ACA RNA-protein complex protein Gar1 [Candidatus Thorarchaeota archaeon]